MLKNEQTKPRQRRVGWSGGCKEGVWQREAKDEEEMRWTLQADRTATEGKEYVQEQSILRKVSCNTEDWVTDLIPTVMEREDFSFYLAGRIHKHMFWLIEHV